MKNLTSLLLAIVLLSVSTAHASHWAGADLTYRCLGGNDYRITMSYYRDCSGALEPATVQVWFNCRFSSVFNFSAVLTKEPGTGIEITPTCPQQNSSCNSNSGYYGVRQYVYSTTVTLPPCDQWTMSYSNCCRNTSNTISSPISTSGYIEATLDNQQFPCNSSPTFSAIPLIIINQGSTFCYNSGAIDPDGDSLSYELVSPQQGYQTNVSWLSGFSSSYPISPTSPVICNPLTGDLCMTPDMNILGIMAVLVRQWKTENGNPILAGTNLRDMQIIVISSSNKRPVLGGFDLGGSHAYSPSDTISHMVVPLGTFLQLSIWGWEPDTFNAAAMDSPEKFNISWNQGIQSASFTSLYNNTDSARGNFVWDTYSNSSIQNSPNCFTVKIEDGACPYMASNFKTYCITVIYWVLDVQSHSASHEAVNVFPNPVNDGNLRILFNNSEGFKTEIFDAGGQRIIAQTSAKEYDDVKLSHLVSGMYFYRVTDLKTLRQFSGKIIVEN